MNAPLVLSPSRVADFRTRLLLAMMVVVTVVTAAGLFFAQRNLAATVQHEFEARLQATLAARHSADEVRHTVLAERCRALVRRSRIHAALEDNALDLLYPSARDELRDLLPGGVGAPADPAGQALRAAFYRFLDSRGAVISPPAGRDFGALSAAEEQALSLPAAPQRAQMGYLFRTHAGPADSATEIIAMPIVSMETGEVIAALVLGFAAAPDATSSNADSLNGIWLDSRLHLPALPQAARETVSAAVAAAVGALHGGAGLAPVQIEDQPYRLFLKRLNPDSQYPPVFDVSLFPLADWRARQSRLRWQFVAAGFGLLTVAFVASHWVSFRLARPVERLAVDSEENRSQRQRAEAALELTSAELQRSARFSANASHQLKTPVSVLRAGLEEMLAGEKLTPAMREEVSGLVHQTFRLTSIIEDLLLLSRMDAGRLQLELRPLDLTPLIEGLLDDLSALPDPFELAVEISVAGPLIITGERRYTALILQNLLENARKYNRPAGRIRIAARPADDHAVLTIGNTGPGIPAAVHAHIFERFHRGPVAENVPGHGLGLNLARELVRLHGGDLRLVRSDDTWTEFEVRFRLAGSSAADSAAAP